MSITSPARTPFVLDIDLGERNAAVPGAPPDVGAVTVHERHATVDRSLIHLGDLFYLVEGTKIRLATTPVALAGSPPLTDHLLRHLLARSLAIRGEVDQTAHERVGKIPARGVAQISPDMARSRCAPFPWPQQRKARGRRARDVEARLTQLAGATVDDAIAVSGGLSSAFLLRSVPDRCAARVVTVAGEDRPGPGAAVSTRCGPLARALAEAGPGRSVASALGLRPLFAADHATAVVSRPRPENSGVAERTIVPWLTASGARIVHDLLESSRHSWEAWLSEVDPEQAALAWSWSDPDITAVLEQADRLGTTHRSPVQRSEFVELACALPAAARTDSAFLRRDAAPGTVVTSGEQRLRKLAVARADARAAHPVPNLVLAEAGLIDPAAFAAVLTHPFLREQHALALIRTLEVEQWLKTR